MPTATSPTPTPARSWSTSAESFGSGDLDRSGVVAGRRVGAGGALSAVCVSAGLVGGPRLDQCSGPAAPSQSSTHWRQASSSEPSRASCGAVCASTLAIPRVVPTRGHLGRPGGEFLGAARPRHVNQGLGLDRSVTQPTTRNPEAFLFVTVVSSMLTQPLGGTDVAATSRARRVAPGSRARAATPRRSSPGQSSRLVHRGQR